MQLSQISSLFSYQLIIGPTYVELGEFSHPISDSYFRFDYQVI